MEGIIGKGRGRKIDFEQGMVQDFFKRGVRISKERRKGKIKKRRQIKESNSACHWEGFKLMIKKWKRKVKKKRDKYILQLLLLNSD